MAIKHKETKFSSNVLVLIQRLDMFVYYRVYPKYSDKHAYANST